MSIFFWIAILPMAFAIWICQIVMLLSTVSHTCCPDRRSWCPKAGHHCNLDTSLLRSPNALSTLWKDVSEFLIRLWFFSIPSSDMPTLARCPYLICSIWSSPNRNAFVIMLTVVPPSCSVLATSSILCKENLSANESNALASEIYQIICDTEAFINGKFLLSSSASHWTQWMHLMLQSV